MNNPRLSSVIRAGKPSILSFFFNYFQSLFYNLFLITDKGRRCKALFSYSPTHEDELALAVGDEIQWLGEVEEGWWRGKLSGKVSSPF